MRKTLVFLVLTIVVGLLGSYHAQWLSQKTNTQHQVFQRNILELDQRLLNQLDRITNSSVELKSLQNLWKKEGVGFVVYNQNKAVDWTTNAIPFSTYFDSRHAPKEGIVELGNAWYLTRTVSEESQLLVAYALLKTNYDFENRYISNSWGPSISVGSQFTLTLTSVDAIPVSLTDGPSAYSLRLVTAQNTKEFEWNAMFWLLFLVLLLMCLWHASNLISQFTNEQFGLLAFVLMATFVRFCMLWLEQPSGLYRLEIFGPTAHATSSILPSLGDFILHLSFSTLAFLRLSRLKISIKNAWFQRLVGVGLPVLLLWPVFGLHEVLIVNSSFSLDLNSPFSLSAYSILGLITSFLILFNFYLVFQWLFKSIQAENRSGKLIIPVLILAAAILSVMLGGNQNALIISSVGAATVGFLALIQNWMAEKRGVYLYTPNILAFSFLACILLSGINDQNEQESRKALARKIDKEENPITEYLFDDLRENIEGDRKLRLELTTSPINSEPVLSNIHEKLSYDHWNRYVSIVDLFNEDGGLLVSDRERVGPNYFELQAEFDEGKPTISEFLKYVGNTNSEGGYLARLYLEGKRSQKSMVLFIRLVPEKTDDILGFTDLFVDEEISTAQELEGYSYALYTNGELQERNGDYAYSLSDQYFTNQRGENTFVSEEGISHLLFRPFDERLVVVSKTANGFIGYLTTFSYLFLFYLVCSGLLSLISGKLLLGLERKSFRNRINLAMSSVLFVSLLLIGILTVFYVVKEYNERNEEMISEKSKSVLIEMEHKLRDRTSFGPDDEVMLSALLIKFSKVFFTDINLYHLDGKLLATSRPRLYDEGLMAEVIDPVAYAQMRFGQKSSFIQEETIGNLSYLTAYVPFRNEKREVVAFMSLPYFARQYGLQQEVFSLLAALTNIYVFLILISVVLALIISNRITEPLRFIRESLKNLKLDQANRAIEWNSNDEIGELVDEYNRTLNELVQSAELLAKSEREHAWREMAKQVAHEIKNPLTPMKLSIQMLERSMNDGADDLNERITRTAKTLIEQIDTLSNIATEFSSFAQMPKSNIERVDLRHLLESTVQLYQNSEVSVSLHLPIEEGCMVNADKEQLLRVFNNLIKNSIQAIPEERAGQIVVELSKEKSNWIVSVSDNGSGIEDDLRDRIFVPNFTTKSSGMGLGLAMVKNIVESVNGEIWFESEIDKGTVFYISLTAG